MVKYKCSYLEDRFVACVDELMGLEAVGLGEASVAHFALVRLFPGVDAEMTLQLERVRRGVRAMRALVRPLTCNQKPQD